MRRLKRVLAAVFILMLTCFAGAFWLVERQGHSRDFWSSFDTARVVFDQKGIPTIEGTTWQQVIKAQGYVEASERLFQMDLLRRKAGGRLSEWFGEVAFESDKLVQLEDRLQLVKNAANFLSESEKLDCDVYAAGVNRFIDENNGRWGLEYVLLGESPEHWSCADSLLVLLEVAESLSEGMKMETNRTLWKAQLPEPWDQFLWTKTHPWNEPLFGGKEIDHAALPSKESFLPKARPIDVKQAAVVTESPVALGSNDWAWRGRTGYFLANDPHLKQTVPQLWFAERLRVSAEDWVVGVSIPGMPGIVLGMNPYLAWAFTNTNEDVDDLLLETISGDGRSYLAAKEDGKEVWRDIRRKIIEIRIKGEDEPRRVEALFTHRGPLSKRDHLGDGLYSRQWLALKPEFLRLPANQMMRSRNFAEANAAIDQFTIPSQNVLIMDHDGGIGYRVSGSGVKRRVSGLWSQPGLLGEWLGFEPSSERRRVFHPRTGDQSFQMATANERIWVDKFGHYWFGADRKERITRYLASRDDFTREDMERLQFDTQGRFRQTLLAWVSAHAPKDYHVEITTAWQNWDGDSRSNELAFTQSSLVEAELTNVLVSRLWNEYAQPEATYVPYKGFLRRSWLLTVLSEDHGMEAFGFDSTEIAAFLLDKLNEHKGAPLHSLANHWAAQHPFVGRLPFADRLFRVKEPAQWGASDLVNAEQPKHGPSVRLVWDLKHPLNSTWSLPVGQSGHIRSTAFRGLQDDWHAGRTMPVFDETHEWKYPDRVVVP